MFRWMYLDPGGRETGTSDPFPNQETAEAWMGEVWSQLLASGVERVVLRDEEEDRTVYRMGLREE